MRLSRGFLSALPRLITRGSRVLLPKGNEKGATEPFLLSFGYDVVLNAY